MCAVHQIQHMAGSAVCWIQPAADSAVCWIQTEVGSAVCWIQPVARSAICRIQPVAGSTVSQLCTYYKTACHINMPWADVNVRCRLYTLVPLGTQTLHLIKNLQSSGQTLGNRTHGVTSTTQHPVREGKEVAAKSREELSLTHYPLLPARHAQLLRRAGNKGQCTRIRRAVKWYSIMHNSLYCIYKERPISMWSVQ